MLKVGLTGGIGSGKTLLSRIFKILRVPVYNSDERAKHLMAHDDSVKELIKNAFGEDVYNKDILDTKKLSGLVFKDKSKLSALNNIVHPAVFNDFDQWVSEQSGAPYILKEAALIFESGSFKHLDKVINVSAPEEMRILRVIARDQRSREDIQAIIKNQLSEEDRNKRSDYVIYNDQKQSVLPQLVKIHEELKGE